MIKHERYRSGYVEGVGLVKINPLKAVSFARGYFGGYIGTGEDSLMEGARGVADGVLDELERV